AVVSDTGMIERGIPTLSYGLRGVTALEVKVTGPKMDLHSGVFGGAVANPITALAQTLATLHDREGHVTVAGFYDRVKPLENWEREAWRKLPIDGDKLILKETGVPELFGEAGQSALRKAFNHNVALMREGGSIPIVSEFRGILGVETLLMGLALADCRAHSPNENFPLENLEGGIRLNKAVLEELAG